MCDAFYEDARQEALTLALGQVQCPNEYHWLLDIKGTRCARCMAVQ
jgi:hypothetical protein